jgi:CO/xanthine dehydrogenase Mo-binding subunit/CO/xanthine dehydrogenase FAD-binding subunit
VRYIGERVRPVDWIPKTTGTARFVLDRIPDGALFSAVVRSPHPHARILSCDISKARALPGVHAVITADDFADRKYFADSPMGDRHPLAREKVRFIGEEVVAIAAETKEIAQQAASLVRVRYRRLSAPTSVEEALRPSATRLHRRDSRTNVSVRMQGEHGDFAAAVARSSCSVRGVFSYPRVAQAPMEPSACIASWDHGVQRMEIWSTTQSPLIVTEVVAEMLKLDREQVVFREASVGGGFGARSRVCEYEVLTAMLSLRCGRPVVTSFTREEEFSTSRTRHAFLTDLTAHADADGRIQAFDADVIINNGAYNLTGPFVMSVALHGLGGLYRPTAARWDAKLVDTAVTPGGQMRGLGYPQVAMASECLVDRLAEQQGFDPLDYRVRNANVAGQMTLGGGNIGSTALVQCLQRAAAAVDWRTKKTERTPWRGVGIAAGMHGSGDNGGRADANRSDAAIDLFGDGRARLRYGSIDFGTHQRTVLVQIAADVLGLDIDRVEIVQADTQHAPFELGQWGSRGTYFGGHAVRLCAQGLAERLHKLAAAELGGEVTFSNGFAVGAAKQMPLGELATKDPEFRDGKLTHEASYIDPIVRFDPDNPVVDDVSGTYAFAAHAAEIEVDPHTGEITIRGYVAAHDVGRALNPSACEGQIIGGAVMGLGAVLGEELIHKDGRPVNPTYLNYALPRAADVPSVEPILIEGATDNGPWGAKSVGELPTVLAAPAVLNALYDATSIRFDSLPLTPDKVLSALRARAGLPARRYWLWRRPTRWQIDLMRKAYPFGVHRAMHRLGRKVAHRYRPPTTVTVDRPTTVAQLAGSASVGAIVLGGGTDLRLQIRQGLQSPTRMSSVADVDAMRHVEVLPGGDLRIGAGITLSELIAHPDIPAVLRDAARSIASEQIRNVATLGGNLVQAKRCWFYRNGFDCYKRAGVTAPCYAVTGDHRFYHAAMDAHRCQAITPSDLATALAALNARVLVASTTGEETVDIGSFYSGPGETVLERGQFIHAVDITARDRLRLAHFEKLALWTGDFAVVSVCASVAEGSPSTDGSARLVFGALAPTPWRARSTEQALDEHASAQAVLECLDSELSRHGHPLPRNGWKLDAAHGLARRALEALDSQMPTSTGP